MSMTYREIMTLGLAAINDSLLQAAAPEREKYEHLNNGIRWVTNRLELPELGVPNATVPTVAGQDYVEHDCGVYAIKWILDQSTGSKLDPEEDGMRGRARHIETGSDRPPTGELHRYVREGNRIWLRDTPDAVKTLTISFRIQPPKVTSDNADGHPMTPEQYDWAIVYAMVSSYFKLHPPRLPPDMVPDMNRYKEYEVMAISVIDGQKDPVGLETRDQRFIFRTPGYDFGVVGR